MNDIVSYLTKAALSGVLVIVALACVWQVYRLWFVKTLILAPFDYVRDGKPEADAGEQFTRRVNLELSRISAAYRPSTSTSTFVIAPVKQAAHAMDVSLPELRQPYLETVELKAYGMDIGSILKRLRRLVESTREIEGSVSVRNGHFTVYAGPATDSAVRWEVIDALTVENASQAVACRIFRWLVSQRKGSSPDVKIFDLVSDEDFTLFHLALDDYQRYRIRKADQGTEEMDNALKSATSRVDTLRGHDWKFPYAYKLAALVYLAGNRIGDADNAILKYADWVKLNKLEDEDASVLFETIHPLHLKLPPEPAAIFRSRYRPVQPGTSVGTLSSGTRGTITCIVTDGHNFFLLSADAVLMGSAGAEIVQPSKLDSGTSNDVVAGYHKSGGYAAIALLRPDMELKQEIPGFGGFKGIAAKVNPGDKILSFGCGTGRIEGEVLAERKDVEIEDPLRGVLKFERVFTTSLPSGAGDIGAPVVAADGKLIGFVYWVGETGGALVIPIQPGLTALGVALSEQ